MSDELPERDDLDLEMEDENLQNLADREIGFQAGLDGLPNDDTQSRAWQRGWADAQE